MPSRLTLVASLLGAGAGIATIAAVAQGINAGDRPALPDLPFTVTEIADFEAPWAIALLPEGRLLVTEHDGRLFLITPEGQKTEVANVPRVQVSGQLGLHDIAPAPDYANSGVVYLTYNAPGEDGSQIVLARAVLRQSGGSARLSDLTEIWRQPDGGGGGGHPGAIIAFDPAGEHIFLTVGERTESETAQDPAMARGKILRLNLDGSAPADNPWAGEGPVQSLTWSTGHRNPYGLAFAPDGVLWEHEMGPRGGDEFNRIEPGGNYGWSDVSEGTNYDGSAIPNHDTRPEFIAPPLYWTPVIAPSGLSFYTGAMFPDWEGSALIGALAGMALVRVEIDDQGQPDEAERFDMATRIRDVAVAPDGAVWLIEDGDPGRLMRLTP